jgi:hypothetical protein
MLDVAPFEPAGWDEVEALLAEAIRSSAGGQMTRNAEVFLAGVCAKHLADRLALAGSWLCSALSDLGQWPLPMLPPADNGPRVCSARYGNEPAARRRASRTCRPWFGMGRQPVAARLFGVPNVIGEDATVHCSKQAPRGIDGRAARGALTA